MALIIGVILCIASFRIIVNIKHPKQHTTLFKSDEAFVAVMSSAVLTSFDT